MKNLLLYLFVGVCVGSQAIAGSWRQADAKELKTLIPARVQVEKDNIETELRTASGITNGSGAFIAGVKLNMAGYAAADKYSTYLIVQKTVEIGDLKLAPGEYVFGSKHKNDEMLIVKFYGAHSGELIGSAEASRLNRKGRIDPFRIAPPGEHSYIEIGRFGLRYTLAD